MTRGGVQGRVSSCFSGNSRRRRDWRADGQRQHRDHREPEVDVSRKRDHDCGNRKREIFAAFLSKVIQSSHPRFGSIMGHELDAVPGAQMQQLPYRLGDRNLSFACQYAPHASCL